MNLLRKRCIKGKSCGATCIVPHESCLLELPRAAAGLVAKVKDRVKSAPPEVKAAAEPTKETPKQKTSDDSFQDPPSQAKFDFAAEGAKPGVVEISVPDSASAESVKINHADDVLIKKGQIGQYEVAALERMKDTGFVPELKGVKYDSSGVPRTVPEDVGGHVLERRGQLAMGIAPGKPVEAILGKNKDQDEIIANKLVLARMEMHLRDIAHNDMHELNVFFDPKNGKLTLIDMGFAQINPKAALIEALGYHTEMDFPGESLLARAESLKNFMLAGITETTFLI